MNHVALAGRLVRNAVSKGSDRKVLLFTVATQSAAEDNKDRVAHVPCAVFGPSEELERSLVQNGQGIYIELEGRITTSSYETNGEKKYSTEVIVFNRSITLLNH